MYLELFEIYSALKLKIDLDKIEFQHSIIFVNEHKNKPPLKSYTVKCYAYYYYDVNLYALHM